MHEQIDLTEFDEAKAQELLLRAKKLREHKAQMDAIKDRMVKALGLTTVERILNSHSVRARSQTYFRMDGVNADISIRVYDHSVDFYFHSDEERIERERLFEEEQEQEAVKLKKYARSLRDLANEPDGEEGMQ